MIKTRYSQKGNDSMAVTRKFVVEITYSPKTTFHNAAIGAKTLARQIENLYDYGYKMDVQCNAVEFVNNDDLSNIDELLHPEGTFSLNIERDE